MQSPSDMPSVDEIEWTDEVYSPQEEAVSIEDIQWTDEVYVPPMATSDMDVDDGMTDIKDFLHSEEGFKDKVYSDSLGFLTAGYGHKLTQEELKNYKEGDVVEQSTLDKWFEEDTKKAHSAALKQAEKLGVDDPHFVKVLTSVNFQLGTSWNKEHKDTWDLMRKGKFEEAADEAANSTWNKQTPDRVRVFQEALRSLAEAKQYADMGDGWYKDPDTGEKFEIKKGKRL